MRLKKINKNTYIDRKTGKIVPKSTWGPIINRFKTLGIIGQAVRRSKPVEQAVTDPSPDVREIYERNKRVQEIARDENITTARSRRIVRDLEKDRIENALATITRRYGITYDEAEERYIQFSIKYQEQPDVANWVNEMYPGRIRKDVYGVPVEV